MFSHARQRVIFGSETTLCSQIAGGAVVNRCDSRVKGAGAVEDSARSFSLTILTIQQPAWYVLFFNWAY